MVEYGSPVKWAGCAGSQQGWSMLIAPGQVSTHKSQPTSLHQLKPFLTICLNHHFTTHLVSCLCRGPGQLMIFFRRSATQQFFSSSRACARVDGHRRPRQRDVHQIYHPGTWAGAGGASVANRVARRTIDILGLFILASAYAYTVRLSRTVCLAIATTKCMQLSCSRLSRFCLLRFASVILPMYCFAFKT